jgi:hypothetical protein
MIAPAPVNPPVKRQEKAEPGFLLDCYSIVVKIVRRKAGTFATFCNTNFPAS